MATTNLAATAGGTAAQFALSAIAIVVGSGVVQIVIFLLRRKTDLRALDRTSGATEMEGQGAFIDRVLASEKKNADRADALEERIRTQQTEFAEQSKVQRRQSARLSAEVANLRTDLGVSQEQVAKLTQQLGAALDTESVLRRLLAEVREGSATSRRIEAAAEGVADDLADAHRRADAVTEGRHGAAADAASQQTADERNRPQQGDSQ